MSCFVLADPHETLQIISTQADTDRQTDTTTDTLFIREIELFDTTMETYDLFFFILIKII